MNNFAEKIVTGIIVMVITFPLAIWKLRWYGNSWRAIIIHFFVVILIWIFFIL